MTGRGRRNSCAVVGLAVVLCAAPGPLRADDGPSRRVQAAGMVSVGRPLLSFAGWQSNGQILSLKDVLGRAPRPQVLVVTFFATWCPSCKKNLPAIQRVVKAGAPRVKGLVVDVGEEPEAVQAFADQNGLELPVLVDRYGKIAGRLGVGNALPRTIVVTGVGVVSAIFEHEGSDFEQALAAAVDAVVASAPVASASAGAEMRPGPAAPPPKAEASADAPRQKGP